MVVEKDCSPSLPVSSSPDVLTCFAAAGVSTEMVELGGLRALPSANDDVPWTFHFAAHRAMDIPVEGDTHHRILNADSEVQCDN